MANRKLKSSNLIHLNI